MDTTLAPCSTATLTFSSGLLSTMDHSTTNSITSVLPVSSSVIDNNESDNLRIDRMNHLPNMNIPYNGQPTAILRCNTMPFEERVLDLTSSVMVGRAVARFKPSPKNAIFDCKVLSRNHALLWYDNGKFFLQDTKSSNGTFVNNQRLSYANTESEPKEVFSSDIVQFGVDVVDNTRKVSHGCVVATLELLLPSGDEAPKRSPHCGIDGVNSSSNDSSDGQSITSGKNGTQSSTCSTTCHQLWRSITIPVHRVMELEYSLKEALNRESDLEAKLSTLQKVLTNVIEATERSWKSMVEEDRMLSRIQLLENKLKSVLTCNSLKSSDDKISFLKEQIEKLHDERELYESTAKESLLLSNNKFIQLNDKYTQVQGDLEHLNGENKRLNELNCNIEKQLETLADSHEKLIKEYDELTGKHKTCDETIAKLKSDIEMATSMGSTSTFTKSREIELEQQLAEMEKQMIQSQGEMKQAEDILRDELEMKINGLNDEISILRKKLSQLQDEHNLCSTNVIKVNGTTDTPADAPLLSVKRDEVSSSDHIQDSSNPDTVKVDDNSSTKMNCLLKQMVVELTDKVQNLTSALKVQTDKYAELASLHNECTINTESLKKSLLEQETCHQKSISELTSQVALYQAQVQSEKDKFEEFVKSCNCSSHGNSISAGNTAPSNHGSTTAATVATDASVTDDIPRTHAAATDASSSSHMPSDTIHEPAHTLDDEHFTEYKLQDNRHQLPTSLSKELLASCEIHSMATCLNPLESPDGVFIIYDLILATFFILLLYFGSPSVY